MAVLSIRMIGDPVLRTPAAEVTDFGQDLVRLVDNMLETMHAVRGAGLAAPQVGVGLRVFTYAVDGQVGHVVNPQLTLGSGMQSDDQEGCLSVPGIGFALPRVDRVSLTGFDVTGATIELEASGMLSRCFQHETDHLDGRLYIDRLAGEDRRTAMRAIRNSQYNAVATQTVTQRSAAVGSVFGMGSAVSGQGRGEQ
ncbi:peptide deformylase [Arthrobacter sp. JZ12]|uniref:peptide deformylase n=1 Tax=Arthrobacter sp. JZ12 TaxID=2654190 RepID=UPI002B48B2F9|nr:peptide deformylase [Arthrobacter sp. JZ12]WRH25048.1 peptide deformylase [Arthrobacter sp. JZ12]